MNVTMHSRLTSESFSAEAVMRIRKKKREEMRVSFVADGIIVMEEIGLGRVNLDLILVSWDDWDFSWRKWC